MELKSKPRCPSLFELAAEATKFVPRRVHSTWAPFLGMAAEDVVETTKNEGVLQPEYGATRGRSWKKAKYPNMK